MELGIGEGELAVVYFITNWRQHCLEKSARWLVASAGIGQSIVIVLVMFMGMLRVLATAIVPRGDATFEYILHPGGDGLFYDDSRIFEAICVSTDGTESVRLVVKNCTRLETPQKIFLFVVV